MAHDELPARQDCQARAAIFAGRARKAGRWSPKPTTRCSSARRPDRGRGGGAVRWPGAGKPRHCPVRQRSVPGARLAARRPARARGSGRSSTRASRRARSRDVLGAHCATAAGADGFRGVEFGGRQLGDVATGIVLADQLFDRRDVLAVLRGRQHEGTALPAGASGAPDAVDVILGMVRHIEIEDMRQALDVEPARRDIAARLAAGSRRS